MNKIKYFANDDLLFLRPKLYYDKTQIINFSSIIDSGFVNTYIRVVEVDDSKKVLNIKVVDINDNSNARDSLKKGTIWCFGKDYLKRFVKEGEIYYLYAKAKRSQDFFYNLQFTYFELHPCSVSENGLISSYFGRIEPIYNVSNNTTNIKIRKANALLLKNFDNVLKDYSNLNLFLIQKIGMSLKDAFALKTFPKKMEDIERSRRAFASIEVYFHIKDSVISSKNIERLETLPSKINDFISSLDFKLTLDQHTCLIDIVSSLNTSFATERILQGDVGCGKTLVFMIAAFAEVLKHKQVAIMVPTVVLASQHYQTAISLFKNCNINIALLTSLTPLKERKAILQKLKNGEINIIISTNLLVSPSVEFNSLSFVVVDEEQRFGAKDKQAFSQKGQCVHILYSTATPLPRSITRTITHFVPISCINTMPEGRNIVKTLLVSQNRLPEAYNSLNYEFNLGHQAYFVAPSIDDETGEMQSIANLEKELSVRFSHIPYAILHSGIKEKEKSKIFNDFINKKILYLIATSMVEVGVNNPNATIMFVEDANRFGLSALHQLRGRVGRGNLKGWCFLTYRDNISDIAKERLNIMRSTNDGFLIAEKDLELRGQGDVAGVRQSGKSIFQYFDVTRDADLLDVLIS